MTSAGRCLICSSGRPGVVLDLATGVRMRLGEGRTPVWTATVRSPDHGCLPVEASQETRAGLVHRVFLLALDRPADPAGLQHWTDRLARGASPTKVAASVLGSGEHVRRFGQLDTARFVSRIYTHGLRRGAEAAGLAFWTGRIERGTASRASVLLGFARSRELVVRITSAPS